MDTIFVVSSHYLTAIYKESKKYSLAVQGYGSFAHAMSGILRTNALDLLGFAIVDDSLPAKGSKEYKCMLSFLQKCELLHCRKKVVLLLLNNTVNRQFTEKFQYLKFFAAKDLQYISDNAINKNVFGSLLLDKYQPYVLRPQPIQNVQKFETPIMHAQPMLSPFVTQCQKDLLITAGYETTLANDEVYKQYCSCNNPLRFVRELKAKKAFGLEVTDTMRQFYQSVESMDDSRLKSLYVSLLLNELGEGEVTEYVKC